MKKIILSFVAFLFIIPAAFSQGLLDELDEITKDDKQEPDYAFATFKGVRLINGHSVEMPAKGEMIYMIAHRFGSMENGFYDMFGLDRATMRMGFEYTLPTDFVCVGIGRSTYNKTYDAFVKAKTDMIYLSEGVLAPGEVRAERGLNPEGAVEMQEIAQNANISGGRDQDKKEESARTENRSAGNQPSANPTGDREE